VSYFEIRDTSSDFEQPNFGEFKSVYYNESLLNRHKMQQRQPIESYDIEDQLVQDEIEVQNSQDISKRRLNTFIGLISLALFLRDNMSRPYIEKKLKNANEQEIDTVIRIV